MFTWERYNTPSRYLLDSSPLPERSGADTKDTSDKNTEKLPMCDVSSTTHRQSQYVHNMHFYALHTRAVFPSPPSGTNRKNPLGTTGPTVRPYGVFGQS
eukprot:5021998-Pyramimonas_sp.AAC.3